LSRLDVAAERFRKALDSLEKSAQTVDELRRSAKDREARIAALVQEREKLLARIAELEEEAQAQSGLNEEVEDRLDGAIAEIRAALGR
jgi:cell division protein FtsB